MANNDINTTNFSLKKIVSDFQTIATNHGVIQAFGVGDASYIGSSGIKQYPLLWIDYLPATGTSNSIQYVFQVISADLIENGESDLLNRRADTIQILWDIMQSLEYNYDYDINFNNTYTPFQDNKVDKITGWFINLGITIPMVYTICDIPAKAIQVVNTFNLLSDSDDTVLVDSDDSNLIAV